MNTADIITLASMAGLALVGLSALGGLRQAMRMTERQTRRADAAREQWERARGAVGSWRARALDAENAVVTLRASTFVVPTDDVSLTYRDGFHDGAQHRADRMAAGLPVITSPGDGDATRTMSVVEGVEAYDGQHK